MNSIGSSTVMMCPFSSLLILSIIAASVVLLPEPVGPVTSTRPRGRSASLATIGGRPSSSKVRTLKGICRITSETQPRCLKQLPRNRARFWMPKEKSSSLSVSKRFFWFSVSTEYASDSVSFGVSTSSVDALVMSPSTRSLGRPPATMCRSEASFSIISSSSARRLTGIVRSPSRGGFLHDLFQRGDAPFHLHQAVHAQGQHAFFDGRLLHLLGRGAAQHVPPQQARHRHPLVEPLPALVAGAVAGIAARALEERALVPIDPERMHLFVGVVPLLLAVDTDAPHEALRHDDVHRARDVERLDPHVDHPGDRGRGVVGRSEERRVGKECRS